VTGYQSFWEGSEGRERLYLQQASLINLGIGEGDDLGRKKATSPEEGTLMDIRLRADGKHQQREM